MEGVITRPEAESKSNEEKTLNGVVLCDSSGPLLKRWRTVWDALISINTEVTLWLKNLALINVELSLCIAAAVLL